MAPDSREPGSRSRRPARTCPRCASTRVVPIVHGLPPPDLVAQAERGEVQLGGCMITGEDPRWHCAACGWNWPHGELLEQESDEES